MYNVVVTRYILYYSGGKYEKENYFDIDRVVINMRIVCRLR